jgi:NADH:ubiquinone oxidoreductase subunit F (NADH-binding)
VLGAGFQLEIRVVAGQGSYVCGEETALLNAIEGHRGEVRVRPPFPAEKGLWGCPTVVNNIETLVNVPWIVARGPDAFRALGTADSPGTKAFCLSAGFRHPGVVEAPYGISLDRLIRDLGGGGADGELAGVSLGGPMGSILLPGEWDVAVDYPTLAARGLRLGHGGLVALPAGTDWADLLVHWAGFMARESCGKCVPCRLGSARAERLARQLLEERGLRKQGSSASQELQALLELVAATSLCGFGQGIPGPMETLRALAAGERP